MSEHTDTPQEALAYTSEEVDALRERRRSTFGSPLWEESVIDRLLATIEDEELRSDVYDQNYRKESQRANGLRTQLAAEQQKYSDALGVMNTLHAAVADKDVELARLRGADKYGWQHVVDLQAQQLEAQAQRVVELESAVRFIAPWVDSHAPLAVGDAVRQALKVEHE